MRRTARLFRAAAVAALAGAGGTAVAQHPHHHAGPVAVPPAGVPCPPPAMTAPCPPVAGPIAGPIAGPLAGPIGGPSAVDTLTAPPSGLPADDSAVASATPAFGGSRAGAGPGATTAVNPGAYIDGAVPVSQVRIRGDFAYDNNRPDRAEFFYPKCGCFARLPVGHPLRDPSANGPPEPERNVDYQEVATYFETLLTDRFSAFAEVPVRFINPDVNRNAAGLGDVNFGFKYAMVLTDCRIVTFQLRTVAPTGIGRLGLGAENWRVEPGILWQNQVTDRLIWFGEVRDSIPVDRNTDFAGNVLRYGLGTAYFLYSSPSLRVMPVSELVGWTVLSGKEATEAGVERARGDTIVNAKGGVRFGFGEVQYPGTLGRSDLYLGYGRAITGERWYEDIYRVEFRVRY